MWYIFQLSVIGYIIYLFTNKIETDHGTPGHIVMFGILLAYGLTWLLVKIGDAIKWVFRLLRFWLSTCNRRNVLPPT